MIRTCHRCGKLPTIHKTVHGGMEMTSVRCDDHWYVGSLSWYPSEEDAIDDWNMKSLTQAFLDGYITWEEAKTEARSLATVKG